MHQPRVNSDWRGLANEILCGRQTGRLRDYEYGHAFLVALTL